MPNYGRIELVQVYCIFCGVEIYQLTNCLSWFHTHHVDSCYDNRGYPTGKKATPPAKYIDDPIVKSRIEEIMINQVKEAL